MKKKIIVFFVLGIFINTQTNTIDKVIAEELATEDKLLVLPIKIIDGSHYGNWQRECGIFKEEEEEWFIFQERCLIKQNFFTFKEIDNSLEDIDNSILKITAGYLSQLTIPSMVIRLPLGIYLPSGILFKIKGFKLLRNIIPFQGCSVDLGCYAVISLNNKVLHHMSQSDSMILTFGILPPNQDDENEEKRIQNITTIVETALLPLPNMEENKETRIEQLQFISVYVSLINFASALNRLHIPSYSFFSM